VHLWFALRCWAYAIPARVPLAADHADLPCATPAIETGYNPFPAAIVPDCSTIDQAPQWPPSRHHTPPCSWKVTDCWLQMHRAQQNEKLAHSKVNSHADCEYQRAERPRPSARLKAPAYRWWMRGSFLPEQSLCALLSELQNPNRDRQRTFPSPCLVNRTPPLQCTFSIHRE